jgi:sulfite reductase (NADPH) flavoprotein alpha-component
LKGGAAVTVVESAPESEVESGYNKKNPFPAPLVDRYLLNGEKSAKSTTHIAFSLAGSGLVYETGDALGVRVKNCPDVVDAILAQYGLDPAASVGTTCLREALISDYEVRHLIGKPAEAVSDVQTFLSSLRKLQPRLYSISSSPKAHPGEVHLTVGVVKYETDGMAHKGVASTYLGERLALGDTTGVFVHTAKHFRLPTDASKAVIMVGPGTGIAPFRAFLEEREAVGGGGKNWLFFGDQRRASDFLYHDQIIEWVKSGHLTRLDTAFSRDQEEKIYVQHRMMEAASELWAWLEAGAHFYVCGDAKRMAKDVDAALRQIVQKIGGRSSEEADDYIESMKQQKRYQRDVY